MTYDQFLDELEKYFDGWANSEIREFCMKEMPLLNDTQRQLAYNHLCKNVTRKWKPDIKDISKSIEFSKKSEPKSISKECSCCGKYNFSNSTACPYCRYDGKTTVYEHLEEMEYNESPEAKTTASEQFGRIKELLKPRG